MTLGIGNHVAKLDGNGEPVKGEQQAEFEVMGLTACQRSDFIPESTKGIFDNRGFSRPPLAHGEAYFKDGEEYQFVLLRKVQ